MKPRVLMGMGIIALVFSALLPGPKAHSQKEPYKIGAVFSVTGGGSFLGDPEKKTAKMIADEINRQGGINGHPLELIIEDDETDATKCNLSVKKLIKKDEAPVIIGPSTSGTSLAVVGVAEEAQVPLISCAASYKIVTPVESHRWIFKVAGSDSHVVEKMYDYMKAKGIKKVAIMTVSDGFGASGREELLRLAGENGVTIVADERYGPQDTDLSAQMTKIRSTQPQAIVNWSIGPTQILAIKSWRDLAMDSIPFFQSHGFGNLKNLELPARRPKGSSFLWPGLMWAICCPIISRRRKSYWSIRRLTRTLFKEPVSSFGGHAWDAMHLAVSALKAVGPDPAKIRDISRIQRVSSECTGSSTCLPRTITASARTTWK